MKKVIRKIINKTKFALIRSAKVPSLEGALPPDMFEKEFHELYALCKPYSMTSPERMYSLYKATEYVLKNNIPGDFVECGVWRGGSSMLVAQMLASRNVKDRKIYLYDTFEGMSEPGTDDVDIHGAHASKIMAEAVNEKETSVWCLADLHDVQQNMAHTGFAENLIVYVKGKVEDTIPQTMPKNEIALLRLDTDWYESTKHELTHLYPKLIKAGVLIIDDYGHWEGCRKAVDEFFGDNKIRQLLNRIDYTGRIGIKD